ncbi:MAG: hypothetical protein AAFR04_05990 [Pseudomonadota bacterium]
MAHPSPRRHRVTRWSLTKATLTAVAAGLGLAAFSSGALALKPAPDEKKRLKQCERDICGMIVSKSADGRDLSCNLTKTWSRKSLTGGKKRRVTWLFGDAQCNVDLQLKRAMIVSALTAPKLTIKMPVQSVNCTVERSGKAQPVKISLSPKIQFKKGRAKKVWIKLRRVEGPGDIKSFVWTAAKLEDSIGIFQRPMIKQINKFIAKKCPRIISRAAKG